MAEDGGDIATHAFCARCSQIEPAAFSHIKIVAVRGFRKRAFVGLEIKCQNCDFEITKIGCLGPEMKLAV